MLRAVWFILKVVLFTFIALWLTRLSEPFVLCWQEYVISVHSGLFIALAAVLLFILIYFYGVFSDLMNLPSRFSFYRHYKKHEKSLKAIEEYAVADAAQKKKAARKALDKLSHTLKTDSSSAEKNSILTFFKTQYDKTFQN